MPRMVKVQHRFSLITGEMGGSLLPIASENMTNAYFHNYVTLFGPDVNYLSFYNPGPKLI